MVDPMLYPRALHKASELTGISTHDIRSKSRIREVTRARWLVWLALHRWDHSFASIGRRTGYDHSTIRHGVNEAKYYITKDPGYALAAAQVAAA